MAQVFDLFPRLKERIKQQAGWLSGGEQQMVAIGRALMAAPRLLLLDEVSLGLAPLVIEDIFDRLGEVRRDLGTAMLLVEQNARVALEFAEYGYILESGRIVLEGPSDDAAGRPHREGVVPRRPRQDGAAVRATPSTSTTAGGADGCRSGARDARRHGGPRAPRRERDAPVRRAPRARRCELHDPSRTASAP